MLKYNKDKTKCIFNGYSFSKDDRNGYYRNTKLRSSLHRYIWELENGELPEGYVVHHLDHDKENNNIDNLISMSRKSHSKYHAEVEGADGIEGMSKKEFKEFHAKGIDKAREWHRSSEGLAWHKEHYENIKHKLYIKREFKCEQCSESFEGTDNGRNRFCSNKCKSRFRRASGVDDEVRNCLHCGKPFTINKYKKTTHCSRSCSKLR